MRISDWSSDVCSSDLLASKSDDPAVGRTIVETVGTGRGLLDVARNDPALLHARCRCPTRQAVRRPRLDRQPRLRADPPDIRHARRTVAPDNPHYARSEEHTSEPQSPMSTPSTVCC